MAYWLLMRWHRAKMHTHITLGSGSGRNTHILNTFMAQ